MFNPKPRTQLLFRNIPDHLFIVGGYPHHYNNTVFVSGEYFMHVTYGPPERTESKIL